MAGKSAEKILKKKNLLIFAIFDHELASIGVKTSEIIVSEKQASD